MSAALAATVAVMAKKNGKATKNTPSPHSNNSYNRVQDDTVVGKSSARRLFQQEREELYSFTAVTAASSVTGTVAGNGTTVENATVNATSITKQGKSERGGESYEPPCTTACTAVDSNAFEKEYLDFRSGIFEVSQDVAKIPKGKSAPSKEQLGAPLVAHVTKDTCFMQVGHPDAHVLPTIPSTKKILALHVLGQIRNKDSHASLTNILMTEAYTVPEENIEAAREAIADILPTEDANSEVQVSKQNEEGQWTQVTTRRRAHMHKGDSSSPKPNG
ncbi:hypothetical protein RIF29_19932 [Crotalaria pallida]|uniref:Uncharacterized protein n=1 Tax=Crotalaria pallida TaxID=3830 RepID=A0AAN9I864_CROPI